MRFFILKKKEKTVFPDTLYEIVWLSIETAQSCHVQAYNKHQY